MSAMPAIARDHGDLTALSELPDHFLVSSGA